MQTAKRETCSEKFDFHYYGYPVVSGRPHGKVGTCPIEIKKDEDGRITVTISELVEFTTTSVMNRFEHIATKLRTYCLLDEDPKAIQWKYHDVKDLLGEESVFEVVMVWNGEEYAEPKWINRRIIPETSNTPKCPHS